MSLYACVFAGWRRGGQGGLRLCSGHFHSGESVLNMDYKMSVVGQYGFLASCVLSCLFFRRQEEEASSVQKYFPVLCNYSVLSGGWGVIL